MNNRIKRDYIRAHQALMMESANAGAFRNVPGKRAPVLTAFQVKQVERYIRTDANNPFADLLKFRLSVYAGLRVSEITNISIADMVGADGAILPEITIRAAVGKGGKQRKIPMHPKITEALQQFRRAHPDMPYCGFSMRWYTPKRQKVNALTNQMCLMYRRAGLPQHSSHSGRRTFITNLARNIGRKYTLRDVQLLAGHARLDTTELYIEPSSNIVDLVGSLK